MEVMDSSDCGDNPVKGNLQKECDDDADMEICGTTKLFRIEIENNSGLMFGYVQVKKILTKKLNLKLHKIKIAGKITPQVFVTFTCEDDQEEALKAINSFVWKDQYLSAKKVDPIIGSTAGNSSVQKAIQKANSLIEKVSLIAEANSTDDTLEEKDNSTADPSVLKRKADLSTNPEEVKKAKINNHNERFTSSLVKQATTPLWHMPYELQLSKKEKDATKFLTRLTTELTKVNPVLKEKYSQSEEGSLCCPLLSFAGSPETYGYCNKYGFKVGPHPESERPTVGFGFSSKNFGARCVAEAWYCNNVPQVMVKAAELFQAYIRVSSLAVFDSSTYEGFWRQLTVRTSRNGHLLLVVVIHPQNLSEEEMEDKKMKLKAFFSAPDLGVTSLYFQKSVMMDKSNSRLQHLSGTTYIEEDLLGLTLRIGPDSSFPANTSGAEVLVSKVKELASLTQQTTVLYLCCGMGAVALSLASDVSKVIGIDLCQAAIEDAWHNVRTNGIENVEFVCGKVEDVILRVLNKVSNEEDLLVILDHPKTTLSNKITRAIRTVPNVKRLLYLSGNLQQTMPHYLDLCRPTSTQYRGTAFEPVKSVAVDLLPQTNHWELVLLFERP